MGLQSRGTNIRSSTGLGAATASDRLLGSHWTNGPERKGIADITGLVAADRVYIGLADKKSRLTLPKIEGHKNSYVNEHANLLRSIVEQKPINEARQIADSTLSAIMGRISAYTGQMVTWDEIAPSDFTCKPTALDFEYGSVQMPKEEPPLPPAKLA